jgi:sulfonate transport system substrate-binding protein
MKRTAIAFLYAALISGALSRSGRAWAQAPQPQVIRFGIAGTGVANRPFLGGNNVAVAQAQGLLEQEFKKDGVKIQWQFFQGAGPAVNEAIANGLLDFAWQGDLPSAIGKAGGLRTKLLTASGIRSHSYIVVPADSPVTSIEGLRGKKVALFRGTNLQLAANRILAGHGLQEKDLRIINMNQAASDAALATGDIDAAFGAFNLLPLVDRGIAKIVYTTRNESPTYLRQTHVLVVEDFEAKYPDAVQRVVTVLTRAAQWTSEESHREALFQVWAKSGVPFSNFKEDFKGDSLKVRNSPLFDEYLVGRYKAAVADARKFNLIRNDIDVDAWIERKYLNRALKELNLETYWPEFDANGNPKGKLAAAAPPPSTPATRQP